MNFDLDRIDFEILDRIQNNARLSNKELAAAVHLAPSTCLGRVQALRRKGVLGAVRAEVLPEALGVGLQALLAVRLEQHGRSKLRAFWKHLRSLPEVRAAFHVSGAHDFLLHVTVRDSRHLRDFALDAITSRPEVAHLETSLVFDVATNPVLPNFLPAGPGAKEGGRGGPAGRRRPSAG
ncbi:MAG: Lrp/AsnC family transcriptional regulator [Holophagales bacterium]|jgi:DNA-binding Lrp family transcriptional regulator|nr:Lrp/AsnC family transcriptional regulator [Holophagales bacterium]MBK9967573.1 Lrp/AsnC family transcriptional regulator [Holophagales bacterium]